MRRIAPRFAALACATLLSACASTGAPDRRLIDMPETAARVAAARDAPPLRVRALSGRAVMPELPLIEDRNLQRELDRMLDRLVAARPEPRLPRPRVVVLAGTSYHAEVNLEGEVAITLGLLAQAGSEDEIAFVLAHELGHRALGHQDARRNSVLRTRETVAFGSAAATQSIAIAVAADRRAAASGAAATTGAALQHWAGPLVNVIAIELGDAGYSREQEIEADRIGFDLLIAARYNPAGAGAVFNALEADERARDEWIANFRGLLGMAGSAATSTAIGQAGPGINQFFSQSSSFLDLRRVLPELGGYVTEQLGSLAAKPLARRYDDLGTRRTAHGNYEEKLYPDVEGPLTPNPFTTGRLGAFVNARMRVLRELDRAEALLRRGEFNEARSLLQAPAVQRDGGARRQVGLAAAALGLGDNAAASRAIASARSAPDVTAMNYITLSSMFELLGDLPAALAVLREGQERFGASEPFLTHRARILRAMNREAELRQTLEECQRTAIGQIDSACADAARPGRRPLGL